MKTTAAVRRQIGQIFSSKILGIHVNKSDRYDRSSLISQLSKDEKVVNALQALYVSTAEACPTEKNTYSKFPALGDIWYVAKHFNEVDESKKAALQAFLNVVVDCEIMKGQTFSHRINKMNWYSRFKVKSGPELKEPKPIFGGETFKDQPIPSDTKIRHERQKAGDALIPSNLSEEQGKGELEDTANPDAFMKNDALPIIPSIHEAMTEYSNAEPTNDMKYKTVMQGNSVEKDQKLMQSRSTRHTSGYRAKGQYLPPIPEYATVSKTIMSREEAMIEAANSQMTTGSGNVTAAGQKQLNITSYPTTGQGTGGKAVMGGGPMTNFLGGEIGGEEVEIKSDAGEDEDKKVLVDSPPPPPLTAPAGVSASDFRLGFRPSSAPLGRRGSMGTAGPKSSTSSKGSGPVTFHIKPPPMKFGRGRAGSVPSATSTPVIDDDSEDDSSAPPALVELASKAGLVGSPAFQMLMGAQKESGSMVEVRGIADANLRMQKALDDAMTDIDKTIDSPDLGSFLKNFFKGMAHYGIGVTKAMVDLFKSGQDIIDFRKELEAWLKLAIKTGDQAADLVHKHLREGAADYKEIKPIIDELRSRKMQPTAEMFEEEGLGKYYKSQIALNEENASANSNSTQTSTSTTSQDVSDATKTEHLNTRGRKMTLMRKRRPMNVPEVLFPELIPDEPEIPQESEEHRKGVEKERELERERQRKKYSWKDRMESRLEPTVSEADPGTEGRPTEAEKSTEYSWKGKMESRFGKKVSEADPRTEGRPSEAEKSTESQLPAPFHQNRERVAGLDQSQSDESSFVETQTKVLPPGGNFGSSAVPMDISPVASGTRGAKKTKVTGALVPYDSKTHSKEYGDAYLRYTIMQTALDSIVAAFRKKRDDLEAAKLKFKLATNPDEKAKVQANIDSINRQMNSEAATLKKFVLERMLMQDKIELEIKKLKEGPDSALPATFATERLLEEVLTETTKHIDATLSEPDLNPMKDLYLTLVDNYYKLKSEGKETKFWTNRDQASYDYKEEKKGPPPGGGGGGGPAPGAGPGGGGGPGAVPGPAPPPGAGGALPGPAAPAGPPPPPARGDFTNRPPGQPNPLIPVPADAIPGVGNGTTELYRDANGQVQVNSRGVDATGERKMNFTIENSYVPTLRLFFKEGDANIVSKINDNPDAKELNRDVWYSFNAYDWETNDEVDNPLRVQNIIDEARRFHGPLDKDELMPQMASEATQESYNKYPKEVFHFPENQVPDAASLMLDVRGDAPLNPQNADQTDSCFHDVYMKAWTEIPETSPWKRFTQIAGTQVSDSYLRDSSTFKSNDNFADRFENAFIYSADV